MIGGNCHTLESKVTKKKKFLPAAAVVHALAVAAAAEPSLAAAVSSVVPVRGQRQKHKKTQTVA